MPDAMLNLANLALAAAGARTDIASFDEASNEAKAVKRVFTQVVTEVLSKARWGFAETISTPDAATPGVPLPAQWTYAFIYPPDCVRLKNVCATQRPSASVPMFSLPQQALAGNASRVSFGFANLGGLRYIVTNTAGVQLTYTRLESNLDIWEPQARKALELSLAARLAIPLSGDKTLARNLEEAAELAMQSAMLADANETISVQDIMPDWLTARDTGESFLAQPIGGSFPALTPDSAQRLLPYLSTTLPPLPGVPWNNGGTLSFS